MSESRFSLESMRTPSLALARWTSLLLGWVWLGAQGQRLNWSVASGLGAVALWWALRLIVARRAPWVRGPSRALLLGSGLATALGAGWVLRLPASVESAWALMALAAVWALWSAALDALAPAASRCQRPWAGWPPVLAALVSWGVLTAPPAWAGVWLLGALLSAALLPVCWAPEVRALPRRVASGLPQTAMGLMMGSLWLSGGWCASVGWSLQSVVGGHLLLMAALPGLVRLDWIPNRLPPVVERVLPLALVMFGGGLLWAGQSASHGVAGMFLLALAWALPERVSAFAASSSAVKHAQHWLALIGPSALLAVGIWSPALGPQAAAMTYGGLSVVAACLLAAVAFSTNARRLKSPVV